MRTNTTLKNQKGFTLIEIIAVLVLLGILAAVAVPKYLDIADEARIKAAQGQIAEVKGRLATALAGYMLANSGSTPADGAALQTYANSVTANSCVTASTTEGDFTFTCVGDGSSKTVTITVTAVQGTATTVPAATYTFN